MQKNHNSTRVAQFHDIAGNDDIFLTILAPRPWEYDLSVGRVIFAMPLLTRMDRQRLGIHVPVQALHTVLLDIPARGAVLEHLYDY